jgi:hypothetical protein
MIRAYCSTEKPSTASKVTPYQLFSVSMSTGFSHSVIVALVLLVLLLLSLLSSMPSFGSIIAVVGALFWKQRFVDPSSDMACSVVS